MTNFPRVNEKLCINGTTYKNRMVYPPIGTNYASIEGGFTEKLLKHYRDRIDAGVGSIVIEATCISTDGLLTGNQLRTYAPGFSEGLKHLVDYAKANATAVIVQLAHGGKFADKSTIGCMPISPSYSGEGTRVMSENDFIRIKNDFIKGAEVVSLTGATGVELHMAHGYLLAQCLSKATNKRKDMYGGSIENRSWLSIEIIKGIRAMLGHDFQIWCRISAEEFVEGGLRIDDSLEIVKLLELSGADCIHVSCGVKGAGKSSPSGIGANGHIIYMSEEIKKGTTLPVIAVSKITDLYMAEKILEECKADFVAVGRPMIANPNWYEDELHARNSLTCIYCNVGCLNRAVQGKEVKCVLWEDTSNE